MYVFLFYLHLFSLYESRGIHQKKEDTLDQREGLLDELRKELQHKERDIARRLDLIDQKESRIKSHEPGYKYARIANPKFQI